MLSLRHLWALVLAAGILAVFTGCTVDPMERLTEDIKAQKLEVRRNAVLQLANFKDDRTIEPLIDVLQGDDELYNMAAVALVKKGREVDLPDPKKPNPVVDELAKVVANAHLTEQFRGRAAWALGEIGDRRAIPGLQAGQSAKIGELPAGVVRKMATQGLEKLGYLADGRAFDVAPDALQGTLSVLPEPPPLEKA